MDAWLGCPAEKRMFESPLMGDTQHAALTDQFEHLRQGDRVWFENDPNLSDAEPAEIRDSRLSHIILSDTGIRVIQAEVFFVEQRGD